MTGKRRYFIIDMRVILAVFIGFSLIAIWSASSASSARISSHHYFYILRHVMAVAAGLILYAVAARVDMKKLLKIATPIHILSIILLITVFIPGLGMTINGARRWLSLGPLRFQPSEWAKLTLILYLTALFHTEGGGIRRPAAGRTPVARAFTMTALTAMLIFLGNDLSTAVLFCTLFCVVYFLTGIRMKAALLWASTALTAAVVIVFRNGGFRSVRIKAWLDFLFKGGEPSYQLKNSIYGFRMGGQLGMGYGSGVFKKYLPEAHTDFVFSVMGEEMGFWFLVIVIALYILMVYKLFTIAANAKFKHEKYYLYLAGYLFAAQSIINMGVTVGLFPVTGVTLPLISYGRTSYLTYMIILGFARSLEKDVIRRMA